MKIFILALEPLESRYTWDWISFLPNKIAQFIQDNDIKGEVINVLGEQRESKTTSGAFLNFIDTNIWKNTQINKIAECFANGEIAPGDKFLFTDAWHSGLIQIRYMSSLTGIPVEIHSIWHAGSYDANDYLGKFFNKSWSYSFERALYQASDKNYFATEYHDNLFRHQLDIGGKKSIVCGFPFDYLKTSIPQVNSYKEDIILFPHRISDEKQPEIFRSLAKELPHYLFIFCQDYQLSKKQYYDLLYRSKIVFSANLQETLGISCYEGFLAGSFPLVPDRLSYSEIYPDLCKYPSKWTMDFNSYLEFRNELKELIIDIMDNQSWYMKEIQSLSAFEQYFSMDKMLKSIFHEY